MFGFGAFSSPLHVLSTNPVFLPDFVVPSEDVGVMSAAILDIEEDMDLSPVQAEVLVGSLNVIAAFGGLIAGACINVNATVEMEDRYMG